MMEMGGGGDRQGWEDKPQLFSRRGAEYANMDALLSSIFNFACG